MEGLGLLLRKKLRERGMNTVELARRSGISRASISAIIHGHRPAVRTNTLEALARALGEPPDLFFRADTWESERARVSLLTKGEPTPMGRGLLRSDLRRILCDPGLRVAYLSVRDERGDSHIYVVRPQGRPADMEAGKGIGKVEDTAAAQPSRASRGPARKRKGRRGG